MVKPGKHQLAVLRLNGEEQQDGDQTTWRDVQQGRHGFLAQHKEEHQPHEVEQHGDHQALEHDVQVQQHAQADGHPEEHEEEGPDDKRALQREDVEVVVQGLHALVLEELARPAVGQPKPIWEEQLVIVQHQPEDEDQDEWAEVEQLLDGVDEQQDGDAQEQPNPALDLLQDVHHEVGDHDGNGQGAEQVDGDVGQDLAAGGGFLVAQQQVKRHDAEDVREGAFVDHELTRRRGESADAGDDDRAAHDGQRDAVDHSGEPRHAQELFEEVSDGEGAGAQGEQGQGRAAQDQDELVAPEFKFERGFEHNENQADRAQQFQDEPLKGDVVKPHRLQALPDADAHADEHEHAGDVGASREKVGEVRQNDDGAAADDQPVGVDVFCRQLEAGKQEGTHAPKINQILR